MELRLHPEVMATLDQLARDHKTSRAAVIRQALGVYASADHRPDGHYVGITADRECLTTVLMGAR